MEQKHLTDEMSPLAQEASDLQTAPERLVALGAFVELRSLVAANAGTPATYLEMLSKDERAQVRQAVAQNPNTPLDCLIALAREFPTAFFRNPLCSLLDLAQPEWYSQIDDLTWLFLLKSAELPRRWLNWIVAHKKHVAWQRPNSQAGDPYGVWVAARLHVDMPELHADGEHIEPALAEGLAFVTRHPHTPAPLLNELATLNCQYNSLVEIGAAVCEQVRRDIAQNPATPEHLLRQLALDRDQKVRYRVARNPCTPPDIMEQLAADPVVYVRSGIASNRSAPPILLERLAGDSSYEDQYEQARSQIAPKARLHDVSRMKLQEALNNVKLMRGALASNPSTPVTVLERLALHTEPEVRALLIANPVVPEHILLNLADDVEGILWALVEANPRTPAEVLVRLASHQQSRIRIGVVNHPRTPVEVLECLASDAHVRVRQAVAQNPRTPQATLQELLEHGEAIDGTDTVVRVALARNPSASYDILLYLANNQTRVILGALAQNPALPDELREMLIAHEDEELRQQIANHPLLSLDQLERLAQDPDARVQRLARRRLDHWHALGERGQVCAVYHGNLDEKADMAFFAIVEGRMPFYEIWRRAETLDPQKLGAFLAHFQLSAAERQDIFTLLLPAWSQKWKEHVRQSEFCLDLLTEFELAPAWQAVFARSPIWQERYCIALKPGIETVLLEELTHDTNRYVRAAALWFLPQRGVDTST